MRFVTAVVSLVSLVALVALYTLPGVVLAGCFAVSVQLPGPFVCMVLLPFLPCFPFVSPCDSFAAEDAV